MLLKKLLLEKMIVELRSQFFILGKRLRVKVKKFNTLIYGRVLAEDAIDANGTAMMIEKAGEMISKSAFFFFKSLEASSI